MHIVMLTRKFGTYAGGVEKHVFHVAKEAVDNGHTVSIITTHLSSERDVSAFHVHEIRTGCDSPENFLDKMKERFLVWAWMLRHLPLFLSADVIHIHDVYWWFHPLSYMVPKKRIFLTFHGFEAGKLPTQKAKKARQYAANRVAATIAIGGWIEQWYGTRSDVVFYGAAECHASKKKGMGAVFLGRLDHDTGVRTYIEVAQHIPHLSLDIYGWGPLRPQIQRASQQTRNIQYNGVCTDPCAMFSSYSIACVSSYQAMVEAMQVGVAVLAYATDLLKLDYLRSHPMHEHFIIAATQEQLAAGFKKLQTDHNLRNKNRTLCQEWAMKQTWKAVYDQYATLWRAHV